MASNQYSFRRSLVFILAAALGGLLYGHDLGILGPALLYIKNDIPMGTQQTSFLVGSVLAGGAIATLLSGWLADCFGRKNMLIIAAGTFCVGVLLTASAHHYLTLLSGRLIQGLAVGIITIVTPLYLNESAPPAIRGRSVCAFQLMLTFAIAVAYFVGHLFSSAHDWRTMFLSALIPGGMMFVGSWFLPKSPHWLVMKNKLSKAKDVINLTHPPEAVADKFSSIIAQNRGPKEKRVGGKNLKSAWIPLLIVFSAAILTQLTGINSILQYAPLIFKQAGISTQSMAINTSLIVACANFLMTLIAMFLVDTLGRKRLLLIGTLGITLSLLFCGFAFFLFPMGTLRGILFLSGLLGFILSFAIGPGLVIWLIIAELLPDSVRSTGMSIALFLNSMTASVLASYYLTVSDWIGFPALFFICGGFSLLYALLTVFCIPETKGRLLSKISEHFQTQKTSKDYG